MNDDYEIKYGSYSRDEDIDELLVLLKVTYPHATKFSREYKRWQYLDNPNGEAVSFNAYHDGRLIAHYCTIPIKMKIGGEIRKGLLSLDTAVHPDFRCKGLFVRLASITYDLAACMGYNFVIGVANQNSTHGFLSKLGFYQVTSLDVRVGYGDIFNDVSLEQKNHVLYDDDILNWRLRCPSFRYFSKGNSIVGTLGNKPVNTMMSSFSFLPKTELPSANILLPNIYVGIGANLNAGSYFPLPCFIKRSPFNLVFRDLTGGSLPKLTKNNLFFQLLDFDVA